MKRIEWKPKAIRQLRRIKDQKTKDIIYEAVNVLQDFPNCSNIKKLKNRREYRLRVGKWRVFFTDSLTILYIEEVKKRDERTY
ncbi:MAG: type II toxin-antitoxin system RelE/ParE family toxin [Deltaproteobacteria bacterium]|nr:type II toxin-antitoxin system RelE/ParE family toxin [Deltaproteobacteria bacterium]